eukprot:COSAG01_NODE_3525_length_5972_cov_20.753618_5_plen_60_part_00
MGTPVWRARGAAAEGGVYRTFGYPKSCAVSTCPSVLIHVQTVIIMNTATLCYRFIRPDA